MVAIPMLIVSPFGGLVADRVEKRRLFMTGQAVLVLNELAILVLLLTNQLQFWHMLVAVFFMGCTFPFIMPARTGDRGQHRRAAGAGERDGAADGR